jgi:hypothetical protein
MVDRGHWREMGIGRKDEVSPMVANLHDPTTDDLLPGASFRSHHRRRVAAPPADVRRAMDEVTPSDLRVARALMAVRGLAAGLRPRAGGGRGGRGEADGSGQRRNPPGAEERTFVELFIDRGFVKLRDDDRGGAVGAVARFWRARPDRAAGVTDAASFRAFDTPGWAKAVTTLTVTPDGTGSVLTTTTAIAGTDDAARRAFGRYWMLIRVPSGLIRREWLAAIARRAERGLAAERR